MVTEAATETPPNAAPQTIIHLGAPEPAKVEEFLGASSEHRMVVLTRTDEEDRAMEEKRASWNGHKITWLRWRDNSRLKAFMHEYMEMFVGGAIAGKPEYVEEYADIAREIINLYNFDLGSGKVLRQTHPPIKNALLNMRYIQDAKHSLGSEKEKHHGRTGIIVAAGPSLEDNLEHLKRLQGKCVIAAVGRTMRLLDANGIVPQYVVSCEQFDWDTAIFKGLDTAKSILCFPAVASPEVVKMWQGPRLCIVDHNLREIMAWEYSLDGGNSVAHHCLNLLAWFGCDPILMVGVDLGYPKGIEKTHADGTFHEWPKEVVEKEHAPQQELTVKAMDGSSLRSSFAYKDFAVLFEILIANRGKRVLATNPKAQAITGVELIDLASFNPA